ncbi:hypothetical protein ABIE45_001363 [Methylobacterium sp. OAE515]|uniref:hypothetical protein n=1 Tax=Methylobacterium sp. OAE515 TaxID=2817895 RepID=UPI00178B35F2
MFGAGKQAHFGHGDRQQDPEGGMTGRMDERAGRPFGFVLSEDEDRRECIGRSLSSEGFDVLAFIDFGSAQA